MKKSPAPLAIILVSMFALVCFFIVCDQMGNATQLIPQQAPIKGKLSDPVNINTAGEQELILLPGIGENTAAAIVAYRLEYGLFDSIADLTNVPGIGPETIREISNYITVGE